MMPSPRFIAILFAVAAFATSHALAITADDLARYLGVSSWSTAVALPPGSFVTEIYSIKEGRPDKLLLEGNSKWNQRPEKGIVVMLGVEDGVYRVVIAYGGGVTMGSKTGIPKFGSSISPGLPSRLQAGDYVLVGQPQSFQSKQSSEAVSDYSSGIFLRVKATAAEKEAQASH
jgi:hypothetical protein